MVPYYSPNISLKTIFNVFLQRDAEKTVVKFFQQLTGKKYVLLTSSCRAALYVAYQSLNQRGDVIASPLTCKSALEPILACDNLIIFSDINPDSFNINPELPNKLGEDAFAIQAIHLGGIPNEMVKIVAFARRHNLFIIEDCAQALGAFIGEHSVGSFGDVACFSLIKTGYGIGGGVLATNDREIYSKATQLQNGFKKFSAKVVLFRLIRSLLETMRPCGLFDSIYRLLMKSRKHSAMFMQERQTSNFEIYLRRPSKLFFQLFAAQIPKLNRYWKMRRTKAKELAKLFELDFYQSIINYPIFIPSFTKFYTKISLPAYEIIPMLWQKGIEAKHLEHKYLSFYQRRFDNDPDFSECQNLNMCDNYFKIHDHIVSLPLFEKMTKKQMTIIKRELDAIRKTNHLV
ncbi:MAG: DegT/DnrJ/EryC1/StrS family aminotransferase [candidate division KSB1 bacterium]|nr:DegT/DnrJ/EryC1/StrS family aminotransferase [candidate division KSB1 bacterium]